jgi:hypothetical protein
MAGFQFPDKGDKLSGGFRKVDAVHTSGASRLYLYVSDLEKTVEVCEVLSAVDPSRFELSLVWLLTVGRYRPSWRMEER